ncbi:MULTISPECIES: N-formylglutamate amidohydrolase [Roseovarius]|nr:N-formylglutamate amidohydrolase [Roseovarius atlanticus]MBY5989958.1 N-formylglutamate amidohydrolase [Roseovarius atlanticus]MBY6126503.1 N-formylglutamate amidohydrolase [Roseovarius atlanticus]MBY6150997.1 N-formylglutamate amidohydrolase [Roseovarius atlanticus]
MTDPAPVEWVNRDSAAPILMLCEHAGRDVPEALHDLGLSQGALNDHIAWDVGAAELARAIAEKLNAPLILQRYSRLVIDCNRPPYSDEAIPEVSDQRPIPGNRNLTVAQKNARRDEVFAPLNDAIEQGFDLAPRIAAFSIHSYTPALQGGARRPWHAGFLARKDMATAQAVLDRVAMSAPELTLVVNEPYQIDDATDWFIPAHAEPRNLRHSLIEVCNDQISDAAGVDLWATLLSQAIGALLEDCT